MSQTALLFLTTVVVHSPPHAYTDCEMSTIIGIGIGISINIPSLCLLRITFLHHFILLGLKDCLFLCSHGVENTLDS